MRITIPSRGGRYCNGNRWFSGWYRWEADL